MPALTPIQRLSRALRAVTNDGDRHCLAEFARAAGVNGRLVNRAARAIAINADAYLKLCAAVGICPVNGFVAQKEFDLSDLSWNRLAIKILLALIAGKSLRKLSKEWRVEYSAINRAKNGQHVGIDNFLKICAGLNVHPHALLAPRPGVFHGERSVQQPGEAA
jgi:DNA-binding Xre family transcriptional regulator